MEGTASKAAMAMDSKAEMATDKVAMEEMVEDTQEVDTVEAAVAVVEGDIRYDEMRCDQMRWVFV